MYQTNSVQILQKNAVRPWPYESGWWQHYPAVLLVTNGDEVVGGDAQGGEGADEGGSVVVFRDADDRNGTPSRSSGPGRVSRDRGTGGRDRNEGRGLGSRRPGLRRSRPGSVHLESGMEERPPPPTIDHLKSKGIEGIIVSCARCLRNVSVGWAVVNLDDQLLYPEVPVRKRFRCTGSREPLDFSISGPLTRETSFNPRIPEGDTGQPQRAGHDLMTTVHGITVAGSQ